MSFKLVENADMAYLVGVYMGDGHVVSVRGGKSYIFELSSVDRDFLEYVLGVIQKYVSGCNPSIRPSRRSGKCNFYGSEYTTRDMYRLRVCNTPFAKWLVRVTSEKSVVPSFCKASTARIIAFLEGIMDCEGWVTKIRDERYSAGYRYDIGIQMKDYELVKELKQMFAIAGVRTSKMWTNGGRSGKMCGFHIRVEDFAKRMRFHIRRKQKLVDEYMSAMDVKYAPTEDALIYTLDVFG